MRSPYPCLLNLFRFQYRFISNGGEVAKDRRNNKVPKFFYSPVIDDDILKRINSVVGIQVGLSYVSWAKIETKENLISCMNFLSLPDEIYKMQLYRIYDIARNIINDLPLADCYVMESLPRIVASGTGGKLQLSLQATRMQFIAMIVAILNMKQSDKGMTEVTFLAPRTVAKLFHLLVGTEMISSEDVVTKLLSNSLKSFSLLKFTPEIFSNYTAVQRVDKEILGQALLLTITFTELVIHKNEKCIEILFDPRKKL